MIRHAAAGKLPILLFTLAGTMGFAGGAAAAITVTGGTITPTEGTAFSGAVATFSNTGYASNPASDFNATIDWGDGTTDTGTVSGSAAAIR